jgi:methyl-accepting chemotaxis protein
VRNLIALHRDAIFIALPFKKKTVNIFNLPIARRLALLLAGVIGISMQTGERGFLTSGEDRFLQPWNDGVQNFGKHWEEAKRLTADNPSQQKRLDEIRLRQEEFVAEAGSLIQFHRDILGGDKTLADLASAFALGRGRSAMDAQRGLTLA